MSTTQVDPAVFLAIHHPALLILESVIDAGADAGSQLRSYSEDIAYYPDQDSVQRHLGAGRHPQTLDPIPVYDTLWV